MITLRTRKLVLRLLRNQRDYFADRAAQLSRDAVLGATDQDPKVKEYRKKSGYYRDAIAELMAIPVHTLDTLISGALAHERNMALRSPCSPLSPERVQSIIDGAEQRGLRIVALPVKGQA